MIPCIRLLPYLYSCSPAYSIRDIVWVRMIPCTFAPLFVLLLPCLQYPGYYLVVRMIPCAFAPLFVLFLPCSQYPGYFLDTDDPMYVCSLICTLAPLLTVSGIYYLVLIRMVPCTFPPLFVLLLPCSQYPGYYLVQMIPCTFAPLFVLLFPCSQYLGYFLVQMIPCTFAPLFVLLLPCSQYPGSCLGTDDPLYVSSLI
jgi:hypothetical protein